MKHQSHAWRVLASVVLAYVMVLFAVPAAKADAVKDFYQGKTMTMIIGSSVGGGYNQYGRLIARYIVGHIPGHPQIVPRNMPGASGRKALIYVANVPAADGLTLGDVPRNVFFEKLLYTNRPSKVDAANLSWLGSANSEVSLCLSWYKTGLKTLDDIRTKGMVIGASGPTATDVIEARLFNQLAGTHIKIILGYPGSTEEHLAMERGELQGRCGEGWDSIVSRYPQWLKKNQINILGQMAVEKSPELPNVPLINDFAKTDTERQMLKVFTVPNEMGRPIFARGGIPGNRLKALQTAFMAAMHDPRLLRDAKKMNLAIRPLPGTKVAAMVKEVFASSPAAIKMAGDIVNSKEKLAVRKAHFYTVQVSLKSVIKKGKELRFMDKGKLARAMVSGHHHATKITIAGKKAKHSALKVGMKCAVTYEGNLSVAKSVSCE